MSLAISEPQKIEARSFELIDKYIKDLKLTPAQKQVVRRLIHATAEPRYAREILFHPQAVAKALAAIKRGANVIVDAAMVEAGINKRLLSGFGGKVICRINDSAVIRKAEHLKLTRAILAMRESAALMNEAIVAIGNAPTALLEVCRMIEESRIKPSLVVGLPVGFVGARESKEKLRGLKIPYITNQSRKGGSAAAASCVNALLILALGRR